MYGLINGPSINGVSELTPIDGILLGRPLPLMLGAGVNDFTTALGDVVTLYAMDLTTPSGIVRVPISSWQATLQTSLSNYVQCVVPGAAPYVEAIGEATQFTIYRVAVLPSGLQLEYEMAAAPVQQARFDRGPSRYTCTISGYSPGFAPEEEPDAATDRTLNRIRSISSGQGGIRLRCEIDWLLRPSQRAFFDDGSFIVSYINYYVGAGDAYMDVGERV